jgi:hypothetical protein
MIPKFKEVVGAARSVYFQRSDVWLPCPFAIANSFLGAVPPAYRGADKFAAGEAFDHIPGTGSVGLGTPVYYCFRKFNDRLQTDAEVRICSIDELRGDEVPAQADRARYRLLELAVAVSTDFALDCRYDEWRSTIFHENFTDQFSLYAWIIQITEWANPIIEKMDFAAAGICLYDVSGAIVNAMYDPTIRVSAPGLAENLPLIGDSCSPNNSASAQSSLKAESPTCISSKPASTEETEI